MSWSIDNSVESVLSFELPESDINGDTSFSQKVGESFLMELNKPTFFKTRFKISDAIQSVLFIGLTGPVTIVDGVYFTKAAGSALLDFVVIKDNVSTVNSGIGTVADDTYITAAFYYNGIDKISYYVGTDSTNPTFVGESVVTNLPDDEELTITFGIQNGEAVSKTMSVDYILASKER